MKKDNLTTEIVKKIFSNIGVIPNYPFKLGITEDILKLDKVIKFNIWSEDIKGDIEVQAPIWSGKIKINNDCIRGILIDITSDKVHPEYIYVFRFNTNQIYGLRLNFNDKSKEDGLFLLHNGKNWMETNIIIKAQALIGIETVTTYGLMWEKNEDYNDLYEVSRELIEVED